MSQQVINRGAAVNDPTAENLFTAFGKVNANDAELYGKFAALGALSALDAASLTANVTGILPLANGGTNNNATLGAGQLVWSDGSKLTSDANLTWSATTGLQSLKPVSCPGAGTNSERFGANTSILLNEGNNTIAGGGSFIGTGTGGGSGNTGFGANISIGNSSYNATVMGSGLSTSGNNGVILIGNSCANNGGFSSLIGFQSTTNSLSAAITNIGPGNLLSHNRTALIGRNINSIATDEFTVGNAAEAAAIFGFRLQGATDAFTNRSLFRIGTSWIDSTDATRKVRAIFSTFDTAEREYMRADANGSGADVFFNGNSVSIAGALSFGVFTSSALAPVTGYISITDNTGNVRHLACV